MEEKNYELMDIIDSDEEKEFPEENTKLKEEPKNEDYDKDKENLIAILKRLKKQIKNKDEKTIKDVYSEYIADQFLEKKDVNPKRLNSTSIFLYKLSLLIITSIYLVGLFLIASLKKSFWNLFLTSLRCKMELFCDKEEFRKQANFFEYYLDKLLREPVDLNLIMFWNFVGVSISRWIGFRLTSGISLIINCGILLLVYIIPYMNYEPEECKYSYPKIIALFGSWGLMAIFFGGSSLLVQQKLMDYYSLLDLEKEKKELEDLPEKEKRNFLDDKILDIIEGNKVEKDKKKYEVIKDKIQKRIFDSLFIFGLSNLFGYAGKYGIGLGVAYYKKKNYYPNNKEKYNIYNSNEIEQNYNFLFNNPEISDKNETIVYSNDFELNQNIFVFIGIIYSLCIIISVFLYWLLLCCFFQKTQEENQDQQKITQEIKTKEIKGDNLEGDEDNNNNDIFEEDIDEESKKEKEKEKKRLDGRCLCIKINEMCGNIIYFERVSLGQNKNSKACCRLFIESINNYFCNLCCCCYRYEKIHFEKNKQCFCYCYQEKGFCDYFNEFVVNDVQRQIVFCVILYFISKLATIGTKNNYENILKNSNILEEMPKFIISLGGTFLFLTGFIISEMDKCGCCSKKKNEFDPDKDINDCITLINEHTNDICFKYLKKFNKTLIGIISIFIYNVLFGFAHSTLSIRKKFEDDNLDNEEKSQERIFLYITVLTNAYFAFLLYYYCLVLANTQRTFEILFTPSILLTIYIIIMDGLVWVIQLLSEEILYYIQFIFSGIVLILTIIFSIRVLAINNIFSKYDKGNCSCQCCCCINKSLCYNDCCNTNCSTCDCSYLCCEHCCLKLNNCLKENI